MKNINYILTTADCNEAADERKFTREVCVLT